MKFLKLVVSLLLLSCLAAAGAVGRKISDYTETLSPLDGWYFEIAVPGVTNYKVGFGTIVTGVVARVPASIGGASNAVENLNGRGTNTTFVGKTGSSTNWFQILGTNGVPVVLVSSNNLLMVSTNGIRVSSQTNAVWGIYPSFNVGQGSHIDPVLNIGFNVDLADTNDFLWSAVLEADWRSGGIRQTEFIIAQRDPAGRIYRPLAVYNERNGTSNAVVNTRGEFAVRPNGVYDDGANAYFLVEKEGLAMFGDGDSTINVAKLEAFDSVSGRSALMVGGTAVGTTNTDASIGFYAANAGVRPEYARIGMDVETGNASGNLVFLTLTNTTDLRERMRILHNGNVGIGITNALYRLDVDGGNARFVNINAIYLEPLFGATGEIPDGTAIRADNDLSFALSDGAAGLKISAQYWDGTQYRSAWEIANASGPGHLLLMKSGGNVGIVTASPTNSLDVSGHVSFRTNVFLPNLRTNGAPLSVLTLDGDGAVYETATTVIGSTQMVTAAIGTLTVTNALHVGTLYANILNLTNALTTNQVRLGVEDLTNSAAGAPQSGDLFSWDEGMKRWTNVVPRWSDTISNITVSTVGNVLLDFAAANVFKLVLRTNLTYTFTNTSYLTKRAKVYFLQDLIGARTLTAFSLAGGLIQTNENMQFNTNASALELMAVEKGFWVTNLITEWQRDYNPRIGPSLLAQINDDFNRLNDDPMTLNASDGVGTWTSGPGTYDDCSIDFNTLRGSTGAHNMARVLTPTFIDNQSASVVLAGIGGNLLACGPAVRIKSTTDGDCYFAAATTTTSITVSRVTDDGVEIIDTPVASGTFTVPTLVAGSRITLTVSGTTLEVFVNEVSQGTCTDATYSTGQPGIRMFNNTGGADSFTATDL